MSYWFILTITEPKVEIDSGCTTLIKFLVLHSREPCFYIQVGRSLQGMLGICGQRLCSLAPSIVALSPKVVISSLCSQFCQPSDSCETYNHSQQSFLSSCLDQVLSVIQIHRLMVTMQIYFLVMFWQWKHYVHVCWVCTVRMLVGRILSTHCWKCQGPPGLQLSRPGEVALERCMPLSLEVHFSIFH